MTEGTEGDEGDEGAEGTEGYEGDEGDEGAERNEGTEGAQSDGWSGRPAAGAPSSPSVPSVPSRVAALLLARGEMLAVAESSAGGLICAQLAEVAGASRWFAGGVVAYSNHAKQELAGVPPEAIQRHGAASAQTAAAMAAGVRSIFNADWGLAETGIAGPQTGRRSRKPAGVTYVAVCGPVAEGQGARDREPGDGVQAFRRSGVRDPRTEWVAVEEVRTDRDDRAANQRAFAEAALRLLLSQLER